MSIKHLHIKIFSVLVALIAVCLGGYGYMRQQNAINYKPKKIRLANQYQIMPVHYLPIQRIKTPTNLYSTPSANNYPRKIGTTNGLIFKKKNNNLVVPSSIAIAKNKQSYVKVSRQGQNIGWVKASDLHRTNNYKLPFVYYSQFWPSKADDACEIASLKTAMSTQGKGLNVSLVQMVSRIPRTTNANYGYTHNPYSYGSHATINPPAMVRVAREYGVKAKNISGANKGQIINEVTHGHAVICEGPYMSKKPHSDHDMVILGYKPGYFYIADPFARDRHQRKTTWTSTGRFMSQYDSLTRQQHALAI